MQRAKVLLTRRLPAEAVERLGAAVDLEMYPEDQVMPRQDLLAAVSDKDALLCLLTDTIDAELLAAAPSLRVVSNYAVGYDNVDVEAATRRGIPVTNTPGVLTETTADLAWTLILAASRRTVAADRLARSGAWEGWGPMQMLGRDVCGKTLGILGAGRIGQATARRASGFQMKVIYHNRTRLDAGTEAGLGMEYVSLDELIARSDILSVHVPYTEETHHLIGWPQLQAMKETAVLINTARGPIVDEAALVRALNEEVIWAAGLDVYEDEPQLAPGLTEAPRTVLLPHVGSATVETRTAMAVLAVENLFDVLADRRPQHLVNPEVWDERRRGSGEE